MRIATTVDVWLEPGRSLNLSTSVVDNSVVMTLEGDDGRLLSPDVARVVAAALNLVADAAQGQS